MKQFKIWNAFLLLVAIHMSCSQNTNGFDKHVHSKDLTDTIYKNVFEIKEENSIRIENDFLFDVVIPDTITFPIVFVNTKISTMALSTMYPEFTKMLVITPNWHYYDEIAKQTATKNTNLVEPIASAVIYTFTRVEKKTLIDSTIIMGGFPIMEFVSSIQTPIHKIKIYYTEEYASVCCPKDMQWDNKPTREEFVHTFENKYDVNLEDTYVEQIGREGEVRYYYSMKNLSNPLKLNFIVKRTFSRNLTKNNFSGKKSSTIYTPILIDKSNRINLIEK